MRLIACILFLATIVSGRLMGTGAVSGPAVSPVVPSYKRVQTLIASAGLSEKRYLAFPILMRLSDTNLLIGYKRGDAHYLDRDARFEVVRFNPATGVLAPGTASLPKPGLTCQDGEFARFADGSVACYIDVQEPVTQAGARQVKRLGLTEFRSGDGGRTFIEKGPLGRIDGVEYGYAFEAITEGDTTWMLVMTFANLAGGKPVSAAWPHAGSVCVIRSADGGHTWRFVKDLTREFGNHPINESSFVRHEKGFLVTARGYEDAQWLQATDGDFNLKRQANLAAAHDQVLAYMGRPRIFSRDGGCYILGRNYTESARADGTKAGDPKSLPMRLSLLRVDPETLAVTKHVILDNAQGGKVGDGYYAVPYWAGPKGETRFNVITYKSVGGAPADLVRFEYDWNEVR